MKRTIDELAIFGGSPAFKEELHGFRPNIGNREHFYDRLNDILDRRWLTNNGIYVQEFEKSVADMVGVKHCIATCNATVALEIAIRAIGLSGEVIIPSFTHIATAHALWWQQIVPVFCDIDPLTHNIDPQKVEQMITPRTTGIIGVHLYGRGCDVDALTEIAHHHNLKLLFDAAHAFGCTKQTQMIGRFGNAEVFSFHATKFLNTFEGGAVMTNDDDLGKKIRLMKNYGFSGYDNVIYIGTNGKMNEVSAAMGLTNLESLKETIQYQYGNYKQYQQELEGIPGLSLIDYPEDERNNYWYIILEVDDQATNVNRDELIEILHAEHILARRYFYPGCHRMEPYRSFFPHAGLLLPNTERVAKRVMSLPTGSMIEKGEITKICQILRLVVENGSEISHKMRDRNGQEDSVETHST
jgi:dTDP-4-amino-4,6-dideoxygalactose transaminase